jgi:putative oxidoreductase
MHAYWRLSNPNTVFAEEVLFLKNLSMLGAALLISQFGAGPVSIDESDRTEPTALQRAKIT